MQTVVFNTKQWQTLISRKRNVFFVGGIGSGKTFVGAMWLLRRACVVGTLGFVTAPVVDTLTNSTLPAIMNAWAQVGIYEGSDYVIGVRPPAAWGVKPYTHRNGKILTWRWGSYLILDGSDNYNKHRGVELDYIYIDEYRDVKDEAYAVYDGRLRGKVIKELQSLGNSDAVYQILVTTTPPENITKITRHAGDNTDIVFSTSYENQHNLPQGYIDSLRDNYDDITYRREVLGEMLDITGANTYYAFDIAHNVCSFPFNPDADLILCWDFNASPVKPMATIAVQQSGNCFYAVKEWIFKDSNTYQQCEVLLQFLQRTGFNARLTITGDYSGNRRESNATRSDYAIIEKYFSFYSGFTHKSRPTLSVKDRVNSLNAMFCNAAKERRLFIHSDCKKLIEDLSKTRWKENGVSLDDSDPERTHATDALSYFTYNYFPLERKPLSVEFIA